jgi:hypothetical protein
MIRGGRVRHYAAFFAPLACTLLAPGHEHEILHRLNIQLLALFVADHRCRSPAATAHALLGRAGNHALHARKIRRQRLAARMLALLLVRRCWQYLAFAFCRDFQIADPGLQLQQFQLLVGQLLAARPVLRDPLLAQLIFQQLDSQLRKLQPLRRHIQLPRCGIQLLLQLFDDLCVGWSSRSCRSRRMERRIHYVY